jgi:hypothetical protein
LNRATVIMAELQSVIKSVLRIYIHRIENWDLTAGFLGYDAANVIIKVRRPRSFL